MTRHNRTQTHTHTITKAIRAHRIDTHQHTWRQKAHGACNTKRAGQSITTTTNWTSRKETYHFQRDAVRRRERPRWQQQEYWDVHPPALAAYEKVYTSVVTRGRQETTHSNFVSFWKVGEMGVRKIHKKKWWMVITSHSEGIFKAFCTQPTSPVWVTGGSCSSFV